MHRPRLGVSLVPHSVRWRCLNDAYREIPYYGGTFGAFGHLRSGDRPERRRTAGTRAAAVRGAHGGCRAHCGGKSGDLAAASDFGSGRCEAAVVGIPPGEMEWRDGADVAR